MKLPADLYFRQQPTAIFDNEMFAAKFAFQEAAGADRNDTGRVQIRPQRAGDLDVPEFGGFDQRNTRAGGDEQVAGFEVVLGEAGAGTQLEFAHRFDDTGLDRAFEDEIIGDDRTGFNDAIRGDAHRAAGLERAGPAILDDVIGQIDRRPALVAIRLRNAAVELKPVAALVTLDELLGGDGALPDLCAEFLEFVASGGRARLDRASRGLDGGVAVDDAVFARVSHFVCSRSVCLGRELRRGDSSRSSAARTGGHWRLRICLRPLRRPARWQSVTRRPTG